MIQSIIANKRIGKCLTGCIYIIFNLIGALYLGVVPGFSLPYATCSVWAAQIRDLINNSKLFDFHNISTFFPFGCELNEGFFNAVLGKIIILVSHCDSIVALSITIYIAYALGFFSLCYIIYALCKSHVNTIILVTLYYVTPFLTAQALNFPVFIGMLLLPVGMIADIKIAAYILKENTVQTSKYKILFAFLAVFLLRLIASSASWYTGVILASVSCLLHLILLVLNTKHLKEYKYRLKSYFVICIIPWGLALGSILMITASGTSSFSYGLNRFNGSSMDLITFLLPSSEQLFASLGIYAQRFIPTGFVLTGDSSMWNNYFGTLPLILIFIYLLKTKRKDKIFWGLLLTSVVMFVLSLGPALKIGTALPETETAIYNLSIKNQLSFFWKGIYSLFPVSKMRTTYRWIIGTYFINIVLLARISANFDKSTKLKKLIISGLLFLCVLNVVPLQSPKEKIDYTKMQYQNAYTQRKELATDISKFIRPDSKIAVCFYGGSNNSYLAPIIATELNAKLFCGSGDKANTLAKEYIPKDIIELQNADTPDQIAKMISVVSQKSLCDYVLLPFFDLRYDINIWSELNEAQKNKQDIAAQTAELLGNNYTFFYDDNYIIVELSSDPVHESDWENESYLLAPNASFEYELDTYNYDALFINFYSILKQKNISDNMEKLQVTIKQYSDGVELKNYILEEDVDQSQPKNHSITYYNLVIPENQENIEIRIEIRNLCENELNIISPMVKLFDSSELYFERDYEIRLGDEIKSTGGNRMLLHPGNLQYGPYIDLASGDYQVIIHGENLDLAKVDYCWNLGNNVYQPELIVENNEWGFYTFHISEKHSDMEFRTYNPETNQSDIYIDKIMVANLSNNALTYGYDELNSIEKKYSLVLKPNDFTYGRINSSIGKGKYQICIKGENLEKLKEKVFLDGNNVVFDVTDVSDTEKIITVDLPRGGENFNFNIINDSDYDCYINSIHIVRIDME